MQYIYKDAQGNEVGPVAQNVVVSLIEGGEITEYTPIRNALLSEFSEARSHRALADHFKRQNPDAKRRKNETDYEFKRRLDKSREENLKTSAMIRTSNIGEASTFKRLFSIIIDTIIFKLVLCVLLFGAFTLTWNSPKLVLESTGNERFIELENNAPHGSFLDFSENQTFVLSNDGTLLQVNNSELGTRTYFEVPTIIDNIWSANFIWGIFIALYYVFMLGYFAQTIGMKICGCVLVKDNRKDPADYEINYRDAFKYYIMFCILGWTYIFTKFFTKGQGLHCRLIRVKVANVASKS